MSQFFTSGGQSIGVSASASVLPMNIQDWFPLGWTSLISLQSKGLSRVFSNTTVQKHHSNIIPHAITKWSKRPEKVTRKESSVHMLCSSLGVPLAGTLGISWHWQVGIIPLQGFCHKAYEVTSEPQIKTQHLVRAGISFNQSHTSTL